MPEEVGSIAVDLIARVLGRGQFAGDEHGAAEVAIHFLRVLQRLTSAEKMKIFCSISIT